MTGRRPQPASRAGSVLRGLVVVALFVVAMGAMSSGWTALGADGEQTGAAHGAWRIEQAAVVTGRAVVPARAVASMRATPALVVLSVAVVGLAARWCRPGRSRDQSRPVLPRRCQAPRGPPLLAVV